MKDDNGVEISVSKDRLTYWESRQINIGHFDNRHFGISFAKDINLKDKTVMINAKRESTAEELDDSILFVGEALDKIEARIREASDNYVDHDSIEKIPNADLKDDAVERRNVKRARSNEGAQNFKDKINKVDEKPSARTRGRERLRGKKFLDE